MLHNSKKKKNNSLKRNFLCTLNSDSTTLLFLQLKKLSLLHAARQGLVAIRDKWSNGTICEENSNFYQLLKRLNIGNNQFNTWFERKNIKYTSHEVQNEMLQVNFHFSNKYDSNFLLCKLCSVLYFSFPDLERH